MSELFLDKQHILCQIVFNSPFVLDHAIDYHPFQVACHTNLIDIVILMAQGYRGKSSPSCVLVTEAQKLVGIITERDLVTIVAQEGKLTELTAKDVMTPEVITLAASELNLLDIFAIFKLLKKYKIRHLPVVDNERKITGIITQKSLRRVLQESDLLRLRRVKEVMTSEVLHVPDNISLLRLTQIMADHRVSCIVITQYPSDGEQIPVGILTERDVVKLQSQRLDFSQVQVKEVMSCPLYFVHPDESLWIAHQLMLENQIRRLVVLGNKGELLGIITQSNLLYPLDPLEMYNVIQILQRKVDKLQDEKQEFIKREIERNQQNQTMLDLIKKQFRIIFEQTEMELQKKSQEISHFRDQLKKIHRLNTSYYDNYEELFADYLQTGCKIFGLENGMITEVNGQICTLRFVHSDSDELEAGLVLELKDTYCLQVVKEKKTVLYPNIRMMNPLKELPIYQKFKVEAYVGTPIYVHDKIYGVLSFSSSKSQEQSFDYYQCEIIELMAQGLGKFITTYQAENERKKAEEELRKSKHFIQRIVDSTSNIIQIYDIIENKNIYVNQEIKAILGYTPEQLQQMDNKLLVELLHPDDLSKVRAYLSKFETAKEGEIFEIEYRLRDLQGNWHWAMSRDTLFKRNHEGKPQQILSTITDMTQKKQIESQINQAHEQLLSKVEELKQRNQEMILLYKMSDLLQGCQTVEEAYQSLAELIQPLFPETGGGVFIFNGSNRLLKAVTTWGIISSEGVFMKKQCWGLRRGRMYQGQKVKPGLLCAHICQNSDYGESLCVPLIAQGNNQGLLYIQTPVEENLTESKKQLARTVAEQIALTLSNISLQEELKAQSIRDPLTNLFNRRYLEETFERELVYALRKRTSLGIIIIDVDHFKRFNDTFGHEVGDEVLKEVAQYLQKNIRGSDIACRFGGEEFVLILPSASLMDLTRRGEEIRQGIKELELCYAGQSLRSITVSVGVACFPDHGLTKEVIFRAADMALFQAKKQGRDRVVIANS